MTWITKLGVRGHERLLRGSQSGFWGFKVSTRKVIEVTREGFGIPEGFTVALRNGTAIGTKPTLVSLQASPFLN